MYIGTYKTITIALYICINILQIIKGIITIFLQTCEIILSV